MKNEFLESANIVNPLLDSQFGISDDFLVISEIEQLEVIDKVIEILEISEQGIQGIQGVPGIQGIPGEAGTYSNIAGTVLSGHRVVMLNQSAKVIYANSTDINAIRYILGITLNAAPYNELVNVKMIGIITEPSWNWDTTLPIYLGSNGQLTQIIPTYPTSSFLLVVGNPITQQSIYVNIGFPIILN